MERVVGDICLIGRMEISRREGMERGNDFPLHTITIRYNFHEIW